MELLDVAIWLLIAVSLAMNWHTSRKIKQANDILAETEATRRKALESGNG